MRYTLIKWTRGEFAPSTESPWFEPRSGKVKDWTIDTFLFPG